MLHLAVVVFVAAIAATTAAVDVDVDHHLFSLSVFRGIARLMETTTSTSCEKRESQAVVQSCIE